MKGTTRIQRLVLPVLILGLITLCLGLGTGLALAQFQDQPEPSSEEVERQSNQEFPVPLTPLPKTITPCRACHGPEKDFPVNSKGGRICLSTRT